MPTSEINTKLAGVRISSQTTESLPTPESIVQHTMTKAEEDALLQRISPFFSVKKTAYGGRGCFASQKIAEGTSLLNVDLPVGSSVVRPFRKEVCTWCFHYDNGRSMKFRLIDKIYFCSDDCRSNFVAYDFDGSLTTTLCAAEDLYVKCAGEMSDKDVPENENELSKVYDEQWKSVCDWEARVFRMKPSKRPSHHPTVTAEDYAEIRYVVSTLHNMSRCKKQACEDEEPANSGEMPYLSDLSPFARKEFEVKAFDILQSSEMDKVKRYPHLLVSYMNIYKFIRLICPESWLPFVSPQSIRDIIGRNLTNAFGIWSPVTQEGEEREFFGFGVYPSASFFNHSCAFNIRKVRTGASYEFIASRDISPGEELCISYGINGDESVAQRRESLREWFFTCGCTKCTTESENV
ncbi:hypothetical protein OY671_001027 [Metschnikowia pulcherrima]|nr:hypothetical protein OY671_001027 [Metschnikowia pulcherrima]